MFKIFKKNKNVDLYAPVSGELIALESVSDQVFSSKMMGEGVAFEITEDFIYAPCDGTISLLPETLHAFGLTAKNDAEILIHIGLDSVNLNGEGFTKLVSQGDQVKKGTAIIQVDRQLLQEKNIVTTTPMVITNSDAYQNFKQVEQNSSVKSGETIVMECVKK
ncbi:PTS glucose transporter subunit IIA [Tetragenococcus halophilus subsp. flandriensis]|uniref:PTS sugar transporter subunit IIA n=1 Tax=Tetragenococcus halophilus TaxID=51669 RepID=UPI0023E91541|nr:PTS glucose transporter subunit IIA [Tetragenococcus halophilus]GMA08677.1 PTS glucose transporter subunit IIA [Tetragenococcus halophilus subsp. flandriensis]